jgi:hypothetical protein
LKYLSINSQGQIASGPQAPDNSLIAWSLIPKVPTDLTTAGRPFGGVLKSPKFRYRQGETANVVFAGASPRNNFRLEGSYALVQRFRGDLNSSNSSLKIEPQVSTPSPPISSSSGSKESPVAPNTQTHATSLSLPSRLSINANSQKRYSSDSGTLPSSLYVSSELLPVGKNDLKSTLHVRSSDFRSASEAVTYIDASAAGAIQPFTDAAADPDWETVRDDFDWDLVLRWSRTSNLVVSFFGQQSEVTIEWEIGQDVQFGRYRIIYNGDGRDSTGRLIPFQGVSGPFEVI